MKKIDKKWVWIVGIPVVIILVILAFIAESDPCKNRRGDISAKSNVCNKFIKEMGCEEGSTKDILVDCFDANQNGKFDDGDTLFELCKNYYEIETDLDCKRLCGCYFPSHQCGIHGGTCYAIGKSNRTCESIGLIEIPYSCFPVEVEVRCCIKK